MRFVCPQCRGELQQVERDAEAAYVCSRCPRMYPVIGGIPDFRLAPDPYIGIEEDRAKGSLLMKQGVTLGFEDLLRHYYAITPEDPTDLAQHWIRRALAEIEIARRTLRTFGLEHHPGTLLDLGCSSGALLIAATNSSRQVIGVDVAFRWLAMGSVRLREAGVRGTLVCANAEHLPFPDSSFDIITAIDLLEHTREPRATVEEARRVSRAGERTIWLTNNRFAPLPDPQVRLWGVGLLPRRWQPAYVAFRRPDLHVYRVAMLSARELTRLCRQAGYREICTRPSAIHAPQLRGYRAATLRIYNRLTRIPAIRELLKLVGPKLTTVATR